MRVFAIAALGRIDRERALPLIEPFLEDEDQLVREQAQLWLEDES